MHLDILNILQNLLLPLAFGAVVVGGLLVYRIGRTPARPPERPARPVVAPSPTLQHPQRPPAGMPTPQATATTTTTTTAATITAAAVPPAPPAAPPAAPALPWRADLLLVDDSAVVRAKLRRLFEPAGYSIALAPDGEAALALLGAGRYALLITDLEMPRLDGMGLIRATLALPACASMPILAITGHEDLQSQLNQLQAVAGIYRKPWVDDDLLGHVQTLVAPALQAAEAALEA